MDIAYIFSKASIQKGETWIIQIKLVKTCRRLGKSCKGACCTTLIFPAWGGFKSIACFALRQILLLIKPDQNHTDILLTKDFTVIWALKLYYCKTKYHAVTIVELSNPYQWGDNSIKDHLIRSENCHNILNWIWIWIKVITNFLSIRSCPLNVPSIQNYCCQGLPWVNCKRLALSRKIDRHRRRRRSRIPNSHLKAGVHSLIELATHSNWHRNENCIFIKVISRFMG